MIAPLLLAASAPLVAPVPGTALHLAPSRGEVIAAVASPEGPVSVLRVDAADGSVSVLASGLPKDTSWAGRADLDGDGTEEVLAAGAGRIVRLEGGEARPWAADPDLGRVDLLRVWKGRAWTASAQAFVSYGPERRDEGTLPASAQARGRRLLVLGPRVADLPMKDGTLLMAGGPVAADRRRLRTIVIRPPEAAFEAWSLLPEPEQILEQALLDFDGTPILVLTALRTGKLELFGEKLLRVLALEPDRTRRGKPPRLAVTSRMNLWQEARFHAEDVDGDGRRDLVVAYVKGLKDATPTLDAYLARPDGRFEARPRTTELELKDADRQAVVYGSDLDADGKADLAVLTGGRILGFTAAGAGKEIVSRRPSTAAALPAGFEVSEGRTEISVGTGGMRAGPAGDGTVRLTLADLDGDRRAEAILAVKDHIAILRFEPLSPDAR